MNLKHHLDWLLLGIGLLAFPLVFPFVVSMLDWIDKKFGSWAVLALVCWSVAIVILGRWVYLS